MADDNSRPFLVPRPNVAPIPVATSRKSDSDLIAAFLEYLTTERRLAHNTVASYAFDLIQISHMLPTGFQTATREQFRNVFNCLQKAGAKAGGLARKLSALRHFYQYLRRKRIVERIPLRNIPVPKIGKRLPKPVSDADFTKLVEACNPRTPEGLRDLAVLRVLDSCGLRGSELTNLTFDDLHLDEGHIIVRAGKGDKDRFAPIDKAGANALLRYLATSRPALYAEVPQKILLRATVGETEGRCVARIPVHSAANFPDHSQPLRAGKHRAALHPHQLRHRLGSSLVAHGLELREVADILGHSSTDTTEIYVGLDFSYLRQVFQQTHPRMARHEKRNRRVSRSSETGKRQ